MQLVANNKLIDKMVVKIFLIFLIRISSLLVDLKLFITKRRSWFFSDKLSELIEVENLDKFLIWITSLSLVMTDFFLSLQSLFNSSSPWGAQSGRAEWNEAWQSTQNRILNILITRGYSPLRLICKCTQWAEASLLLRIAKSFLNKSKKYFWKRNLK